MSQPKLLDQVREALRLKHHSLRTEEAYVRWIYRYILFPGKRHPAEMGSEEIRQFLSHLATEGRVAASTQSGLVRLRSITRRRAPFSSSTATCWRWSSLAASMRYAPGARTGCRRFSPVPKSKRFSVR